MDLVTAFDIIEHVDDEAGALRELARVCRRGGYLLVTVPAFQFLWGNQDVISHHRRRYTRSMLRERIEAAGFRIATLTYFNALRSGERRAHAHLRRRGTAGHALAAAGRRLAALSRRAHAVTR
jgi:hypothetical protein